MWSVTGTSGGPSGQTIGTAMVVALSPVADTPAAERATWGAASLLPDTDYLTSALAVRHFKTAGQILEWTGRKVR